MKGKFTSVILAVVLVAITAGTIFFGYSKASGKITKSGAEEEQRYAWPLATCSTEDTITHIFVVTENLWRVVKMETSHSLYSLRHHR